MRREMNARSCRPCARVMLSSATIWSIPRMVSGFVWIRVKSRSKWAVLPFFAGGLRWPRIFPQRPNAVYSAMEKSSTARTSTDGIVGRSHSQEFIVWNVTAVFSAESAVGFSATPLRLPLDHGQRRKSCDAAAQTGAFDTGNYRVDIFISLRGFFRQPAQ